MKIKEQIEENKYSLWPRNVDQSGIEKIELIANWITQQVEMRLYHRENVGLNHVYLDEDERECIARHNRRLQNNIKREIGKGRVNESAS